MVPRVTVVVPAWNSARWLSGCLEALAAQTYGDFEVLLADDGSTDGSTAGLEGRWPGVRVIRLAANHGFAAAANAGIAASESPYVALLNVDTRARPGWLAALVDRLDRSPPEVGAVASKMLRMEDAERIDDAGNSLSRYGSARKQGYGKPAGCFAEPREVFSVCAGAALFRRLFLEHVDGFDAAFHSYFEDIDLGLRGRLLGFRYLYEPRAEVLHQGHGSGVGRGRYVFWTTRNRLATLAKGIPGPLVRRHWRALLFGQIYFFLVQRRPLHSLAGVGAFLARLAPLLRQRRRLAGRRVVSIAELDGMLAPELGEPPLRQLVRRLLARRPDPRSSRSRDGTVGP